MTTDDNADALPLLQRLAIYEAIAERDAKGERLPAIQHDLQQLHIVLRQARQLIETQAAALHWCGNQPYTGGKAFRDVEPVSSALEAGRAAGFKPGHAAPRTR